MKKPLVNSRRMVEIPTFAHIANLLVPKGTPSWLPAYLEWSAQGLRHDLMADGYRLTKAQAKARLAALGQALVLIPRDLSDPTLRNILETSGPIKDTSILMGRLRDLLERSRSAISSPLLLGKDGQVKRGRGKVVAPDTYDAKTLCAARVVETWKFFRNSEPGLANLKAAGIAQAYWLACRGISAGSGDPLNGWYDYFKKVRINKNRASLARLRAAWRRDLIQTARRGDLPGT